MAKDTFFNKKAITLANGKQLDQGTPQVMGIVNLTPDSFFEGSRKQTVAEALQQAGQMLTDGAAMLDLGAYSSRPGAEDITVQEETDRLLPIVEAIVATYPEAILSIDTFRASVAEAAIKAGAHIINDISGGQLDADMFATVARLQVPYILMHMKGNPRTMTQLATYEDVFIEVLDYLNVRIAQLKALGVNEIIIDPGFGFAKKPEHGFALLKRLDDLAALDLPLLVGVSRKKMIYGTLGTTAAEALNGTTVLNTIALSKGAHILRVHDVKEAAEAVKLWEAVNT